MRVGIVAVGLVVTLASCGGSSDPVVFKDLQTGKTMRKSEVIRTMRNVPDSERSSCDEMLAGIKLSGPVEFPSGEKAYLKACREGYKR
jgi:hypothetical protein